MTVVAVASAKGSPGATLASLALAATWPRPVSLVDVDPAGGDLVWRLRDPAGNPLDPDRGLLTLAAAARRGASETSLAEHLQDTRLGVPSLIGVSSPDQLSGLGAVWGQLPAVLAAHEEDVIVDCGRIVPGTPSLPVFLRADVVLLVVRPDLEGTGHLRERLRSIAGQLRLGDVDATPTGVVVVTSYRQTGVVDDLRQLLAAARLPVEVLGILAEDEKAARVLASTRFGDPRKSLLGRSARTLAEQVLAMPYDAARTA